MQKKKISEKEAIEQIERLFDQADKVFLKDKSKANQFVDKARKIAMKRRTPLPKSLKRRFCKHCYSYLKPGRNARIRIHGNVRIYCLECKKMTRIPTKSY